MADTPNTVDGLFKRFYGDVNNLNVKGTPVSDLIKFDKRKRVGENYTEAVILNNETGFTLGGSDASVVTINDAVAGAVQQASVKDFNTILRSAIGFQTLSRAAEAGPQAFLAASKHVVKNNFRSHQAMKESLYLHGQAPKKLGAVSYDTMTYRGFTFTTGSGTITLPDGGTVQLVNGKADGVTTGQIGTGAYATKKWLFLGREMAAHIWAGMEGCPIRQIKVSDSSTTSLVVKSVISEYGLIEVDAAPAAATAVGSHVLGFPGQEGSLELMGISAILQTRGSLFGINNNNYSLWRATSHDLAGLKLKFADIQTAIAKMVNRAGLETDLVLLVNPRSWQTLLTEQTAMRHYDASYKSSELENGTGKIKFYAQSGAVEIVPCGRVKENEAFLLAVETWSRFGSAELSFKVPGSDGEELIAPIPSKTAYSFQSYASDCVFCSMPAFNCYISGINDESAT